jgi:hypothetical protein
MTDTSLVEVKSLEKEVQLLLRHYEDLHKQSIADIQKGIYSNSLSLSTKETNDKIIGLLSTIKNKTAILYPKGINNQNVVRMNNAHLIQIADKLYKDQNELEEHINEYNSLDGKNNHLTLELNSTYYEYMFYFVIVIILGLYVVYMLYGGYDSVDMIILICTVALIAYHFMGTFIQYGMNGIRMMFRKIMSAFYLL